MRRAPSRSGSFAGRNRAGSSSSRSRNTPSPFTIAFALRSAEQETPKARGRLAAWRASRKALAERASRDPPNCAPIPLASAKLMAVDRGNENVAYLYEPFHPAVLRLIKMTIDNAKAAGIPVGMCGEMAADPAAAYLLLGLGLEEFSMSSGSLAAVKRLIRSVDGQAARAAAAKVLTLSSAAEAAAYLAAQTEGFLPAQGPLARGGHR